MCGIACFVCGTFESQSCPLNDTWDHIMKDILCRGPNYSSSLTEGSILFGGSVLHIQGDKLAEQPYMDIDRNILLWNGEVFFFEGYQSESHHVSDTVTVSNQLSRSLNSLMTIDDVSHAAVSILSRIEGPFSIIYYHAASKTLLYGRDPFGRRSLIGLCTHSRDQTGDGVGHVMIASATSASTAIPGYIWHELDVEGLYAMQVEDGKPQQMARSLWPQYRIRLGERLTETNTLLPFPPLINPSESFLEVLILALRRRIQCVHSESLSDASKDASSGRSSPIGVLFSGGIDSVLLAAVLHLALDNNRSSESIDLINVTFEGEGEGPGTPSPDRLAAIAALGELKEIYPSREWNLVHVDVPPADRIAHESRILGLIQPQNTHMDLNIGTAFWFASRGQGYLQAYSALDMASMYHTEEHGRPLLRIGADGARRGTGQRKQHGIKDEREKGEGGPLKQPCSVVGCKWVSKTGCPFLCCKRCCLQRLIDESIRDGSTATPIAVNTNTRVAYICPVHKLKKTQTNPSHEDSTPEGIAGADAVMNRDKAGVDEPNVPSVSRLPYTSNCKILLVGIGADEQLAGYGRHRTVFQRGGTPALVQELQKDTRRLWKRNLGRDDRCISDHGREAWFPYLDELVVRFLQSIPLDMICDLSLPQGKGDKKILRDAAKLIGLGNSTDLVKRAIQFGTRVAKHTNARYHGSNRKGKGTTLIAVDDNDDDS